MRDGTEALWAAVREDPDDAERKRRLAEHLVAQDDPRGRFMQLQMANPNSDEAAKLQRKHQKAWLGPDLAAVLSKVVFRDGLLHEAGLARSKADAATWARAAADPALATLRFLRYSRAKPDFTEPFLRLPSLRTVESDASWFPVIASRTTSIRRLLLGWKETEPSDIAALDGPGTAELRSLKLSSRYAAGVEVVEALAAAGWMNRLVQLSLRTGEMMTAERVYTEHTLVVLAHEGWRTTYENYGVMVFRRGPDAPDLEVPPWRFIS